MKAKVLFNSLIGIFFFVLVFNSCQKENDSNTDKFPTTPEEIAEAIESTNLIVSEGYEIIENAISGAFASDGLVDPNQLAEQIVNIADVEKADATSTGTGIVIKQKDGTHTNLLVVTRDDDRLFIESSKKSATTNMQSVLMVNENPVVPTGEGKALILAPFHSDFNENLELISSLLASAGYDVDIFENENANLARFHGDYLNNYDVIYISTHGGANLSTRGGDVSTILLTGEVYTLEKTTSLSADEQLAVATGSHDGTTSYFAISVPWIKLTTSQDFTTSWFYADACESAMTDNGSASLSEALLDLNVAGFNGFDATINSILSNAITKKMMSEFTAGLSFTVSSEKVLNDWGLKAKAWALRLISSSNADDAIRVDLFDYNITITDPFYLIHPDDVVGVASVIPSSGPVGTDVIYEVIVNTKFVSQVTRIEFDIDNTGEHLSMSKISTDKWQRTGLRAPTAQVYPRIDTFTFSAFDSAGNLLGRGSATFSILEAASKSASSDKYEYYAE